MSLSFFPDKKHVPSSEELAATLGVRSLEHWSSLISFLEKRHGAVTQEWKHYGKASGWLLHLKAKKRGLAFLVPQPKKLIAIITLGAAAAKRAAELPLPAAILDMITTARVYAEGRTVRIEVADAEAVESVKAVLVLKDAE